MQSYSKHSELNFIVVAVQTEVQAASGVEAKVVYPIEVARRVVLLTLRLSVTPLNVNHC